MANVTPEQTGTPSHAKPPSPELMTKAISPLTDDAPQLAVHEMFKQFAPLLQSVDQRIHESLRSDASQLTEISQYLHSIGGKRVRPLLTLLSAALFGMESPSREVVDVSAGIELIHMATLLHDDIIDESPTRRRQESAFCRFGLTPSLLAGDFLLVRAFGICAHLDQFIVLATEDACVALTEGELIEGKLTPSRQLTIEQYLEIVDKKTASLFALATLCGSHLAGQPSDVVELMKAFGHAAGKTFQIVDDILDITADEDLLGKPVGTDLRQRTPSIVNLLWLNSGDPIASNFFSGATVTEEQYSRALTRLQGSDIVEKCRLVATQHADEALTLLDQVSNAAAVMPAPMLSLRSLISYTLSRCL